MLNPSKALYVLRTVFSHPNSASRIPIRSNSTSTITSPLLQKLHRLSALNPPEIGSKEEAVLMEELNELIGLMDQVKAVELPAGDRQEMIRDLLGVGVGEIVIDGSHESQKVGELRGQGRGMEKETKNGRELLEYATRRVGDYYGFKQK
ncbi:hypothetical protein P7C73_g4840, partial [Tremellales sp. Uapishka_1]